MQNSKIATQHKTSLREPPKTPKRLRIPKIKEGNVTTDLYVCMCVVVDAMMIRPYDLVDINGGR